MSTYEDDHNITTGRREPDPDRSRSHQTLSTVIDSFLTSGSGANGANGARASGASGSNGGNGEVSMEAFTNALRVLSNEDGSGLASDLMSSLQDQIDSGTPNKGISDEYLDSLDRVDIKDLDDDADCPICTNKFVDDKYPLIVKLPCTGVSNSLKVAKSRGHIFDMDCIGPWLKMNSTCPLCRFDLLELNKKRREKLEEELRQIKEEQEEEEEWDDYA